MDLLPPEIIALIVSFLDRKAFDAYATVSRQWQVVVENITFRSLRVQSSELALFSERLALPDRRAALSEVVYEVLLPAYSDARCAKFELRREREANNAAFGEAIVGLFTILKSWEEDGSGQACAGGGRAISLHLGAYSLTDVAMPRSYIEVFGLGERRYEKSVLRVLLEDLGNVPEVRRIAEFQTPGSSTCTRQLRAASVAQIAAKLPNLKRTVWEMNDCAFSEDEIRYKYRKDFADALLTINNKHLTDFSLRLHLVDPLNDAFQMPSGTDPAKPGIDELSVALHTMLSTSPRLLSFELAMAISPSIFGPEQLPSSLSSPPSRQGALWPQLRKAEIHTGRTTAAGTWLYTRDPEASAGESSEERPWARASDRSITSEITSWSSEEHVDRDDSEWDDTYHAWHEGLATGQRPCRRFRTKVDAGVLEEFLSAAARAVGMGMMDGGGGSGGMPRLQSLVVQAGEQGQCWHLPDYVERQIYWACFDGRAEDGGKRRVDVSTMPTDHNDRPKWHPSKRLKEMWEEWVGDDGEVKVWLWDDEC